MAIIPKARSSAKYGTTIGTPNPGEVCPARWRPGAQTLKPSAELVGKL